MKVRETALLSTVALIVSGIIGICLAWNGFALLESWDVDIDVLRAAILRRGNELSSLDLEHLK